MSKIRLVDTGKWSDGWYGKLHSDCKHAWDYINDNCDNAGVWDPNFQIADLQIGGGDPAFKVDWDKFRALAGNRIEVLPNGKWWSTRHIAFQCRGALSFFGKKGPNRPHLAILGLLRKHELIEKYSRIEMRLFGRTFLTLPRPDQPDGQAEEAQQAFKLDSPPKTPEPRCSSAVKEIIGHLNTTAGRNFSSSPENARLVEHVLKETKNDVAGLQKMISRQVQLWQGTEYQEYLQPSTLFAKTKWRERYEKRNEPVAPNGTKARQHEEGF